MSETKSGMRQGDVILVRVEGLPKDWKGKTVKMSKKVDGVILEGEHSGHKHALVDGELFVDNRGTMYVVSKEKTKVVHEEHGTLELGKGFWQVVRQREFAEDQNTFVMD